MATAVCGYVTRAASDEFSGFAKINPVAGSDAVSARSGGIWNLQTMSDKLVTATGTPAAQERPRFNHFSLLTMLTSRLSPGYRSQAGDLNRGLRKRR